MAVEALKINEVVSAVGVEAPKAPAAREGTAALGGEAARAGGSEASPRIDPAVLERSLRKLNGMLDAPVRLSFQLHEGSGRMMVRVINEETGDVIKEIPPKEILDTVARIMEFVGLLLDQRV